MDPLLDVPTAAQATAFQQAKVQQDAGMRVAKMALDSQKQQASQLLSLLGIGANLDALG